MKEEAKCPECGGDVIIVTKPNIVLTDSDLSIKSQDPAENPAAMIGCITRMRDDPSEWCNWIKPAPEYEIELMERFFGED